MLPVERHDYSIRRPDYPSRVTVYEVGPRDGLQNEKETVPTATKIQFIEKLADSGLSAIELTSFVKPSAIPQLADAAEVVKGVRGRSGVRFPVLVPNLKGFEAARAVGVREVAVFTAASETFNRKNINCGIEESIERFRPIAAAAAEDKIRVRGYISAAFGCPYEGKIEPESVREVVHMLLDLGIEEISIGDTIGVGDSEPGLRPDRDPLRLGGVARRRRAPLPRHPGHRSRERLRRAGLRRDDVRLVGRGPRGLPLRPGRVRKSGDGGPALSS